MYVIRATHTGTERAIAPRSAAVEAAEEILLELHYDVGDLEARAWERSRRSSVDVILDMDDVDILDDVILDIVDVLDLQDYQLGDGLPQSASIARMKHVIKVKAAKFVGRGAGRVATNLRGR